MKEWNSSAVKLAVHIANILGLSHFIPLCVLLNWQVRSPKGRSCADQHSQSLDDIRLYKRRHPPLSAALSSDTSHSYTFGCSLEDKLSVYGCVYSTVDCKTKSALYGKRSMNCLSLDLLGEDQLPEEFVV